MKLLAAGDDSSLPSDQSAPTPYTSADDTPPQPFPSWEQLRSIAALEFPTRRHIPRQLQAVLQTCTLHLFHESMLNANNNAQSDLLAAHLLLLWPQPRSETEGPLKLLHMPVSSSYAIAFSYCSSANTSRW
eukprot:5032050-Amphidinium_carterae.2